MRKAGYYALMLIAELCDGIAYLLRSLSRKLFDAADAVNKRI